MMTYRPLVSGGIGCKIAWNSVPFEGVICECRPLSGPYRQKLYVYDTTRIRLRVIDSRKE
jgi:hypothetical protein